MKKPSLHNGHLFGALFRALFCALIFQTSTGTASTLQDVPDLCIAAAESAADQTGVPLPVLVAVTLTETGRSGDDGLKPWPWAVNQAGTGHWFATPDEAMQFVEDQLDLGLRNFDVGCFQINHRWHSKGFTSTSDMFDPISNALYAARFLADLYQETGDWSLAAAAYHSRTPDEADRYRAKFDDILAGLGDRPVPGRLAIADTPRINNFPLLQAGSQRKFASLVPLATGAVPLFGDAP